MFSRASRGTLQSKFIICFNKTKREQFGVETFYDYDNCNYMIARGDDNPDLLKFGFSCNCFKQVMENGGQEMLDEFYKEN